MFRTELDGTLKEERSQSDDSERLTNGISKLVGAAGKASRARDNNFPPA